MKLADLKMAPADTTCDFCSAPLEGKYKSYQAVIKHVIPLEDAILRDDGEWLACMICAGLLDERQWKQLLDRATDKMMFAFKIPEKLRAMKRADIYSIWQKAFGVNLEGENNG